MRFLLTGFVFLIFAIGRRAQDQANINTVISPEQFKALVTKAKTGNSDAEFVLGKCYFNGFGVTQNRTEALRWLEKAANKGVVEAEMVVAISYWNGVDVKMDESKGVTWFQKAAEQGEPGAFHYLGAAYYLGKGVKQDYVESLKWSLVFQASGRSVIPDDEASLDAQIKDIEEKLTPGQINKGRKMAAELKAKLSTLPLYSNALRASSWEPAFPHLTLGVSNKPRPISHINSGQTYAIDQITYKPSHK